MTRERCHHIGLFVRDLKKMDRFYTRHLGFKLERSRMIDQKNIREIFGINSSCEMRYYALDDLRVEIFCFYDIKLRKYHPETQGYNHWTLLVDDKDKFCNRLRRKRIKVLKLIRPQGFTYFIKDPEDNLIEIKEYADTVPFQKKH
ncbi:MAG: VOC family protein [Candidatus Omnitrophota bacterium]